MVREPSRPHTHEPGGAAPRQRRRSTAFDDRPLARPAAEEQGCGPRSCSGTRTTGSTCLRFDPRGAPELATGAEMISSRFFHALGYYVPETYLAVFDREIGSSSRRTPPTSPPTPRCARFVPEHIDRLLADCRAPQRRPLPRRGAQGPHGRRVAGRSVSAVRHAQRRPERHRAARAPARIAGPSGLLGLAEPHAHGCAPHDRHRGPAGGTASAHPPLPVRLHRRRWAAASPARSRCGRAGIPSTDRARRCATSPASGFYTPAWMRAKYPDLPAVGAFDSETFEPEKWTSLYDVAPFANRLPDDAFWAARQVAAFTDEDIRAIVQVAQYSDPKAERWIADCLIERRNRIGRALFRDGAAARRHRGPRRRADLRRSGGATPVRGAPPLPRGLVDATTTRPASRLPCWDRPARASRSRPRPPTHPPAATCWRASRRRARAPGMAVSVYLRRETEWTSRRRHRSRMARPFAGRSARRRAAGPKPVRRARPRAAADLRHLRSRDERQARREPVARRAFPRAQPVRADDVRRDHARAPALDADRRCADSRSAGRSTSWRVSIASPASRAAGAAISSSGST